MTWHLKDRELEKAFEAYSGGKFVDALNYEVKHSNIDSEFIVYVGFVRECLGDDSSEICLCFKTDELEDIPEYNPYGWNKWPRITPPVKEMMRVDCFDERGTLIHSCRGYWDGTRWKTWNGYELNDAETINFRPWED